MEIILTKDENRNLLTCIREDGTSTKTSLGPEIPNHDIAHYVIESELEIKNGFYGRIKSGMSIEQLSDKNIIKNLDSETWLSEILTRNLQSLSSGAVKVENFIELVNWEAKTMKDIKIPDMSLDTIFKMKAHFDELCNKWISTPENGQIKLLF